MKFFKHLILAAVLVMAAASAQAGDYQSGNYMALGGAQWTIGGTLETSSGGILLADPGAIVDLNPTFSTSILGNPVVKVAQGNATLAQVNAGLTVLTGVTGRTIYIDGIRIVSKGGSTATCTAVVFADTAGSPVTVATFAQASLTSGTSLGLTGSTLGAGAPPEGLTSGKGLTIGHTGSNCATATSYDYEITYAVQ